MNAADIVLIAAYASLVVELVAFPIPSEASVWQLVVTGGDGDGDGDAPELVAARRSPLAKRLLLFLLPTALCIALFLVPLVVVAAPSTQAILAPMRHEAWLWPGLGLVWLGRFICFGSVLQLRTAKRNDALPAGMFRISRNPGLIGMWTMYGGLCAVIGGPWLWLGAPLYFLNMHTRVRLEEANLDARYTSSWREYVRRVPRYLPLPGLR
ncbi:MAG: isoprenylcysteine carboxylmethyltransferase family protein [Planctomycetota bacterium]